MRIAIIGQSPFAAEVYRSILKDGHKIAGIFTVMDKNGKQDPVAIAGEKDGIPVFKLKTWRKKGEAIPEVLEQYKSVNADLNVMPYCSQFIPLEVINHPKHKSICYHPSILPRHRGASAISWTLIEGDTRGGFTIFYPDDGLDTGDILLTRECDVSINDTVDSLYNGFMYPEGTKAMAEAVKMIAEERAPCIKQPEVGATYDAFLNKPELCKVNLQQSARSIHNFIRGLDSSPGAWTLLDGKQTKLFGSRLWHLEVEQGRNVELEGGATGMITRDGLMIQGNDGKWLLVKLLSVEGKFQKAETYGLDTGSQEEIIPTDEEAGAVEKVRAVWAAILKADVQDDTDFFAAGAGSMDVVRLIEEVGLFSYFTLSPN